MPTQGDTLSKGFTLVEVIIVFTLISIVSIFVVSQYGETQSATLPPQAVRLVSHLRFAQMKAMNTNEVWGLRYATSSDLSNYWLFKGTPANRMMLPGENGDQIDLSALDISIAEGSFILYFDEWGKPSCPEIPFSSDRLITLSLVKPGISQVHLSIAQNTGFAEWQR